MMPRPSNSDKCTLTYMNGTISVSCVDSNGYQVILLQDNDLYNLTVVNVRPGERKNETVSVVPGRRYCVIELPMGEYSDSEVKYSREFTAETKTSSSLSTGEIAGIASKLVLALSVCIEFIVSTNES